MCDRYPDCQHAGPVQAEITGYPRHCETVLPNATCSYHARGCLGCTFKAVDRGIVWLPAPVDTYKSIKLDNDAYLALVAHSWKAYCILQGLVNGGIVGKEWASKSLHNVIQSTYRKLVCGAVTAYLTKRIIDDKER